MPSGSGETSEPDIPVQSAAQLTPQAQALALLQEHPEWMNTPVRELQSLTGIDRNAWNRAKAKLTKRAVNLS